MQHSEQPRIELKRARSAMESMRHAQALGEFEEGWKEFLRRIERTWNKMQSHYGKSPKWTGWQSKYESLRKKDQLLSYLVNARGAEEHTVDSVVSTTPGGVTINPASGNFMHIESLSLNNGILRVKSPQEIKISFISAKTELLPVVNRGRRYEVPKEHLGHAIDPQNVSSIATAAFAFYESALADAENFFVK